MDLFGPASVNSVTARPADARVFGGVDTFFKDCTNPDAQDGTQILAAYLNAHLQILRHAVRGMGVTESNVDDDLLLKAIQAARLPYAVDTGAANALTITLTPTPLSWATPFSVAVKVANRNTIAGVTLGVTGLAGTRPVVRRDGSALVRGDFLANDLIVLIYDGTSMRLATLARGEVPLVTIGNPTLWVRTDGNDANDGSANDAAHAFATINGALSAAASRFVLAGRSLTIRLGNAGVYAGFNCANIPNVTIVGDTAAQDLYIISVTGGPGSLGASACTVNLSGVQVRNDSSGVVHSVQAGFGGSFILNHVTLAGSPVCHLVANPGGSIAVNGPLFITSGGAEALSAQGGNITFIAGSSLTVSNMPSFSTAFAHAYNSGGSISISGVTMSGGATGKRYLAEINASINTAGGGANFFPGDVAGTTSLGGQYV